MILQIMTFSYEQQAKFQVFNVCTFRLLYVLEYFFKITVVGL
jgi:hypothetical protein